MGTTKELLNGIICDALLPKIIDFAGESPLVPKLVSLLISLWSILCLHCALWGSSEAHSLQRTSVNSRTVVNSKTVVSGINY